MLFFIHLLNINSIESDIIILTFKKDESKKLLIKIICLELEINTIIQILIFLKNDVIDIKVIFLIKIHIH